MAAPSSNLTAWERWELASFDEAAKKPKEAPSPPPEEVVEVPAPEVHLPTAEEIEQIYQQAREDGLRNGHEEGHKAGYEEGQAKARGEAKRLAQITAKFEQSLAEMESAVADELLSLAIALAREVIRQELTAHPESLLIVVREALTHLPHQHAAIYLHPDDASLLRSYAGDQLSHAGHRIHEDFKLKRGDCLLEAGGTQVDATVAMRWQRVLEGLGISAAWETHAEPSTTCVSNDESATPQ
ncbi:flagellar assembly protein FliH [Rhodocyclaceae bacterium]